MHPQMWLDPATVANVETLKSRNFHVMDPDFGRLTGPDSGAGRFPESARILLEFSKITQRSADLRGVKILVTAGGTREAIDPVRYIGNRSSGIQGYAIAEAAAARGAKVELIAANCHLPDIPGVEIMKVESTAQLSEALSHTFPTTDILIMVAAVADARPKEISFEKIKKEELASLELIKNPDLLASLAKIKKSHQVVVGFAAETANPEINARKKLADKGLDFLYVNDVSQGAIFGSQLTEGVLLKKIGEPLTVPSCSKRELADLLLDQLALQLR